MITHLECLVEEASMEAFLRAWLERVVPEPVSWGVRVHQGKPDLLKKLPGRLRGYGNPLPPGWLILVLLDRDDDDCRRLKARLEKDCAAAGLATRRSGQVPVTAATCVAIEELEAWYFGDWDAVVAAFPRADRSIPGRAAYRDPDEIRGGTWEAFEREMKRKGYFSGGLEKIAAARAIGATIDAGRSRSRSFRHLATVMAEALATGTMA